MTASQLAAIRELRAEGYAVILWAPEELNGADPSDVEDQSISFASEYLIPAELATDDSRSNGPHYQDDDYGLSHADRAQFYGPSAR